MLIGSFSINCLAIQTKRLYDKYKLNWDSVTDLVKLLTFHSSGTEGYFNSLAPASWPHGPQRCFPSFNFGLSSVAYWASGMCPKQRLKHTVVGDLSGEALPSVATAHLAWVPECTLVELTYMNLQPEAKSSSPRVYLQTCRWPLMVIASCVGTCFRARVAMMTLTGGRLVVWG